MKVKHFEWYNVTKDLHRTRQVVIDNYFQSTALLNQQLLMFGNAFPHMTSLLVNNPYVLRKPGNLLVMGMCTLCRKQLNILL